MTVFPQTQDGVVVVKFKYSSGAALCIEKMNGRWFAKRQISCEFWDGVTDYKK